MIQIVTTYHFLFSFTIFFFQHENLKNNKNPKISKRSPKIPIPNEGIKRKFHSFFSTSHCETERDRETYYRLSKDRKLEREEEDQTGGEKGKERRGEERRNGHVRECLAVRSGRNSGGRDGIAGGVSGKASLRAGATWSHEVLPDHAVSPPPHLRGRLSPRLRWRPPPLLVHQALPRLSRSPFSLSHSFAVGVCFRVLGFGCCCCDISHIHTYRSCFPSIRVLQLELEHSAFVFLFWNFYVWWNFEFRASEFFEELGRCFTELGFCCCQVIGIQCLESLNSSWSVLGFVVIAFQGLGLMVVPLLNCGRCVLMSANGNPFTYKLVLIFRLGGILNFHISFQVCFSNLK